MDIYGHIWTYTDMFNRFQGHPEVVIPPELCDWWWPASGGSAPSEKTRPGFFEHVYCQFSRCSLIWGPPGKIFQIWPIWSNDYASKTRIEILCTMACYKTVNHFFKVWLFKQFLDVANLCLNVNLSNQINKYSRSIGLTTIPLINVHAQSY